MEETTGVEKALGTAMKKRHNRNGQGGSIYKSGRNGFTIVYRTRDGKQIWKGGFKKMKEARSALDEKIKSIRDNQYVETQNVLFADFAREWMEKSKGNGTLKPKTWASYDS